MGRRSALSGDRSLKDRDLAARRTAGVQSEASRKQGFHRPFSLMVSGLSFRSSERQRALALAISRESPPFVGFPGPLQVHRECWFQRGRRRERCSREEARDALGRARGSVKIAVMLLNGCDPDTAKALLG